MKVSKPKGQNCPHEKTWNEMNLRISKKMTDIQLETLFYLTVFAIQLALRKLSKKFSQSDTGKCEYAVQIEKLDIDVGKQSCCTLTWKHFVKTYLLTIKMTPSRFIKMMKTVISSQNTGKFVTKWRFEL